MQLKSIASTVIQCAIHSIAANLLCLIVYYKGIRCSNMDVRRLTFIVLFDNEKSLYFDLRY